MYKVGENWKCTKLPQIELEHLTVKSILYTLNTYCWGPNFGPFCSMVSRFRDTTCTRLVKMHQMTPHWTWTFNGQKYSIYTQHLSQRPKFWSVSLYGQPFPRYNMYKVGENWKSTEWPQTEPGHITVRNTLYTLNTYPRGPFFCLFRSMTSHFRDTGSSKNGNAPNDPQIELEHWTAKSTCIHQILTPGVQILVRFTLRPAVSKISHILSFPIDYHVKQSKKEQNNLPKIQNFKFHYSFKNIVRDFPHQYTWILGSKKIWCVVSEEMSLETFTPI